MIAFSILIVLRDLLGIVVDVECMYSFIYVHSLSTYEEKFKSDIMAI